MLSLIRLAKLLRAGQVYAHHAHNVCQGPQFFADHAFLGEVYAGYEGDYDDVIERQIGLTGEAPDTFQILRDALDLVENLGDQYFESILMIDRSICSFCKEYCNSPGVSEGTKQLVGEICNKAEMRGYKIGQRLAQG